MRDYGVLMAGTADTGLKSVLPNLVLRQVLYSGDQESALNNRERKNRPELCWRGDSLTARVGARQRPSRRREVLMSLYFHKTPVKSFCATTFTHSVLRGEKEWMWGRTVFIQLWPPFS